MNAFIIFGSLFFLILIGVPIAFCIALSSAFFLVVSQSKPLILIAQRMLLGMDSFVLLAIPLFTLSGYLMEQGGLSKRLVDWVEKIFGWFPGSMGTVTIVCCTIFAALTGSGPATVAAIGAIMIPSMTKSGYKRETAAGLLAAGGALGPIIPPSVAMIVYGSTMNLPIPDMFIAGIIPGVVMAGLFIVTNSVIAIKKKIRPEPHHYTFYDLILSTWRALGVLFLPIIVLGGIYGGFFTPTEAATVCVLYSLALGFFYRELSYKNLISAMKKTVCTSAMVVLILGVSNTFGWILASAKIPTMIANAIIPYVSTQFTYLILLMLILFLVGCIMETLSSIVILAPILVPIGLQLGVDPLHLGVLFCVNLIVGFITPPFGVNLFTAVSTAEVSYSQAVKGVMPFLITAIISVVIFAFVPQIVLFLPSLLK